MMTWHTAWAQLDTEHKTVVSFTAPVEVPGSNPQVLPAGSYTFKVVDSKVNPNIVEVSNKEETHVYTTILAIPTHRDADTDKTVMTFEERAAGEPQALRAWFYPHEKSGQEFVYSKDRATQLAKSSNLPVPYSEGASTNAAVSTATARPATEATPPIMTVSPTGQSTPYTQQAEAIAHPPVTSQQANTPAPVETRPQTQEPVQTASNLPRTASNLPWIAMAGCLLLAAGISIKRLCER
jgi:thiol:disulfide interchange protein